MVKQQYFKVIVERPDCIKVFNYPGYAMLTEHSWCTNAFTDAIMKDLYTNGPAKVAWIGDQAKDYGKNLENIDEHDYQERYKAAWFHDSNTVMDLNGGSKPVEKIDIHDLGIGSKQEFAPERLMKLHFVNLTKKRTLNMYDYIKKDMEWNTFCLFPLAILTACGNGRASGDYFGVCMQAVGSWAFDEIALMDEDAIPAELDICEEQNAQFNIYGSGIAYKMFDPTSE